MKRNWSGLYRSPTASFRHEGEHLTAVSMERKSPKVTMKPGLPLRPEIIPQEPAMQPYGLETCSPISACGVKELNVIITFRISCAKI